MNISQKKASVVVGAIMEFSNEECFLLERALTIANEEEGECFTHKELLFIRNTIDTIKRFRDDRDRPL